MRELNKNDVAAVSGAGMFADLGRVLGSAVGGIVDAGTAAGGLKTDASTPASQLGCGIGKLLEFNLFDAIKDIGAGIAGIVSFGADAVSQIREKNKK